MAIDLLSSLMSLSGGGPGGGVAVPAPVAGQPIIQGENPLIGLQGMPQVTIPSVTAAPDAAANPTKQVTSLEELLFGGGTP